MLITNTRLSLLLALFNVAPLLLPQMSGNGVQPCVGAAVIQARRDGSSHVSRVAMDEGSVRHTQRFFPFPSWDRERDDHKHKRMNDYSPTNPLYNLVNIVVSQLQQRRSIDIPDNTHGKTYRVAHHSREPRRVRSHLSRHGEGPEEGRPGRIDVMSHVENGNDKRLASLWLSNDNGTYIWNASESNVTDVRLVDCPPDSISPPPSPDMSPVSVRVWLDETDYCATWDPSPATHEGPMTAKPCITPKDGANTHASQVFLYNGTSGALQPTWFSGEDDGRQDAYSNPNSPPPPPASSSPQDGQPPQLQNNNTSSPNDDSMSSTLKSAVINARQGHPSVQNVTLVFVPSSNVSRNNATMAEAPRNSTTMPTPAASQSLAFSQAEAPPPSTTTVTIYTSAPFGAASASASPSASASWNATAASGSESIFWASSSWGAGAMTASGSAAPSSASWWSAASAPAPSSTGLEVDLISGSSSSSAMAAAAASASVYPSGSGGGGASVAASSSSPVATSNQVMSSSGGVGAAAAAASSSTVWPSSSLGAASANASSNRSGGGSMPTRVAIAQNAEKTPVSTAPYKWSFRVGQ